MNAVFCYERRVAFSDTDMAGVAHFTAMLRWVEEAEAAWHRARGTSLCRSPSRDVLVGWPKVSVNIDYLHPARFDELVRVELTDPTFGKSSAKWVFSIVAMGSECVIARGVLCSVHAEISSSGFKLLPLV